MATSSSPFQPPRSETRVPGSVGPIKATLGFLFCLYSILVIGLGLLIVLVDTWQTPLENCVFATIPGGILGVRGGWRLGERRPGGRDIVASLLVQVAVIAFGIVHR